MSSEPLQDFQMISSQDELKKKDIDESRTIFGL